jgi:ribosome-binding ATPase YchF (GTP1/OBG family)
MEAGKPLRADEMTDEQLKVTRAFRLFSEKPRLVVFNTADDEQHPERFTALGTPEMPAMAVPAGLELELSKMSPEDRAEFEREMGVGGTDRDAIIRRLLAASGQRLFLTAADKEVRTWLLPQGGTALEAAASIHTDLARGFIRAEVMTCRDLVRLGSEREIKAHHLLRQEPKDYVIQDDDILFIRFSV